VPRALHHLDISSENSPIPSISATSLLHMDINLLTYQSVLLRFCMCVCVRARVRVHVRLQVDDINGDEASGKDQTMVPMDFDGKNGHIIDDVIYSEVVGKLPEGCELFCLFDCCHSGTIMDLPYVIAITPAVEKKIEKVRERERA